MRTLADEVRETNHGFAGEPYWRIILKPNRSDLVVACMQDFDEHDYDAEQVIPGVSNAKFATEEDAVRALAVFRYRLRGLSF